MRGFDRFCRVWVFRVWPSRFSEEKASGCRLQRLEARKP